MPQHGLDCLMANAELGRRGPEALGDGAAADGGFLNRREPPPVFGE